MSKNHDAAVIGSGIIGMTTAWRLAELGLKVSVVSSSSYVGSTSAAAAAFWYPFKAEPADKVSKWARESLEVYRTAARDLATGVVWNKFTEYLKPDTNRPWWANDVDNFELDDGLVDLPAGRRKACRYDVPIIDTARYLPYIHAGLEKMGVNFVQQKLWSVDEAFEFGSLVVNCAGIGAIELCNDHDLHPARGQVIRIERKPHHAAVVDITQDPKLAHITPRIDDTVIGGTYESDVDCLDPDEEESKAIIERCTRIFPELGDLSEDILEVKCGLRPVRSVVRVERESGIRPLFHNYGHGGAGFTLAWGCANAISELAAGE